MPRQARLGFLVSLFLASTVLGGFGVDVAEADPLDPPPRGSSADGNKDSASKGNRLLADAVSVSFEKVSAKDRHSPVLRHPDGKAVDVQPLVDAGKAAAKAASGIYRSATAILSAIPVPMKATNSVPKIFDTISANIHRAIGVQDAYARGLTGKGIVVGVVDTGFTKGGKFLAGKVVTHRNYVKNSKENGSGNDHFHADETSMAIAGNMDLNWNKTGFVGGVAPDARLSQAHLFDKGKKVADYKVFETIYANIRKDGAAIVNHSVSSAATNISNGKAPSADVRYLSQIASKYVKDHGMLMVWSAGNSGMANPSDFAALQVTDKRLQTGGYLTAVALDSAGNLRSYSNRCGIVAKWCLGAPVNFTMPKHAGDPTPVIFAGTSTAAPVISATAAIVKQAFPYLKGDQIGQVLLGTARDLGAKGVDKTFGYGMLDAAKAIRGPGKFDWGDFAVSFAGTSVWQNAISGAGGLVKDGAGILRLTGNNAYKGGTTVKAGALVVDGSVGDVTVAKNAILSGKGKLGSVTSSGILHAGWPYSGTLTINGNYANKGGALSVVLGSKVAVKGKATINGGLLAVDGAENGYVRTGSATVLHADNGIKGKFDRFEFRSSYLVSGKYAVKGKDILVTYKAGSLAAPDTCGTRNACRAATLIEAGVASAAAKAGTATVVAASTDLVRLGAAIQMLPTAGAVRDALREASGHVHPSLQQAGMAALDLPMAAVSSRMDMVRYDHDFQTGFWAEAIGGAGWLDASRGASAAGYALGGVVLGADARLSDSLVAGVYGGWDHMNASFEGQERDSSVGTWFAGAYLGHHEGKLHVTAQAAYGRQDYAAVRSIFGSGDVLTAGYAGNVFGGRAEAGYDVAELGGYTVTPYLAGTYILSRADGFAETGTGAASGRASSMNLFRSEAGVKLGRREKLGDGRTLGLYGKAAVTYDATSSRRELSIGGNGFSVDGARAARTHVSLGVSGEYGFSDRLSVHGSGQLKVPVGGGKVSRSFNVGLKLRF